MFSLFNTQRHSITTGTSCVLIVLGFFIPISLPMITILALSTVVLSLSQLQTSDYQSGLRQPTVALLVGLFLFYLLSSLYTSANAMAVFKDLKKEIRLLYPLFFIPWFAHPKTRRYAINAFLLSVFFILLIAYAKYFGLIAAPLRDYNQGFMNHIKTSYFIAFAGFILAHRILSEMHHRPFNTVLLAIILYDLCFLNMSRTGFVVSAVLFVTFCLQIWRTKACFALLIGLPLIFGGAYLSSQVFKNHVIHETQQDAQQFLKGNHDTSIGYRLLFFKQTLAMIKKHPVWGTGVGSHRNEYQHYILPKLPPPLHWGDPHNQYLLSTLELGILGLIVLLSVFASLWYSSFQLDPAEKYFTQGLVLSFLTAMACDSFLFLSSTGHFFIYMCSISCGATLMQGSLAAPRPAQSLSNTAYARNDTF